MKKPKLTLSIIAKSLALSGFAVLAILPLHANAQIINWHGADNPNTTPGVILNNAPFWGVPDSLFPDPANPSGNTVNVFADVGGDVYGGTTDAVGENANNNSITISGGSIGGDVLGGFSVSGSATGNAVTISGGAIGAEVYGGYSISGNATGNAVTISGGTIGGDVYGGYSSSGSATGNTVTLSGGTIAGGVYGGYKNWGAGDIWTGNTLNLVGYRGSVAEVNNFEYYNTVLSNHTQNGDKLIHIIGSTATNLINTKHTVNIAGGGNLLQAGDTITIIDNATGYGTQTLSGKKGVSLLYDFTLSDASGALKVTVNGAPKINPQTKALSEGRAASMALVTQGADLAAGAGMNAALTSGAIGATPFGAVQGGKSRYKTGSHVDVDGVSIITGVAVSNKFTENDYLQNAMLGIFFEYGKGNYDTYNSFSSLPSLKSKGNTKYTGGGLLTRFDFTNFNFNDTTTGNIYAEASLRAGRSKTDFSSRDLTDGYGNGAKYDSSSTYYGLHTGIGYLLNLTEREKLDIYTKYFWTHQNSDSVTVSGDLVRFEATNSHRIRAGVRYSSDFNPTQNAVLTPYIGAAYEHEFNGKAKASVYGYNIEAPDLKGGTGLGEIGLTLKPSHNSPVSFDIGATGYTGTREGFTANGQLKLEF